MLNSTLYTYFNILCCLRKLFYYLCLYFSAGWIDFWWVPIGAINIIYTYHPCPPLGPTPQADISTPVKEEILLSPIRFPHQRKNRKRSPDSTQKFDPTTLEADTVSVELEIGPSVILLYGTALKNFMNFKVIIIT